MISDKATKYQKCGSIVDVGQTPAMYEEEESKGGFKKYLPFVLGALVFLGKVGYYFWNDSSNNSSNSNNSTNVVAADSASIEADSFVGQSQKEQITKSLEELFDNVVKGDSH